MDDDEIVYIIDDVDIVRCALVDAVRAQGLQAKGFASAEAFLEGLDRNRSGCLVTNLKMPGMGGLELIKHLRHDGPDLPVIVVTGCGTVPAAVQALQSGAADFLEKPVAWNELWECICRALEHQRKKRARECRLASIQLRMASLTEEERQVLRCVAEGMANKAIAQQLCLGLRTVELRRASLMKKLEVSSLAGLVRLYLEANAADRHAGS